MRRRSVCSENRENVIAETGEYFVTVAFYPGIFQLIVPFPRDYLKAIHRFGPDSLFHGLSAMPMAICSFASSRRLRASLRLTAGYTPWGKKLFFSSEAVLEPPPLTPIGGNKQKQAAAVK